jgi:hypothetical protein
MPVTIDTLKHKQWFLRILVFSFVTVIIWVGLSLFRSQQATVIPEELQKLARPLNPNINLDVISRIEQKRAFSEAELSNFPVYRVIRLKSGEQVVVTQLPEDEESLIRSTPSPSPSPTPALETSPLPEVTQTPAVETP